MGMIVRLDVDVAPLPTLGEIEKFPMLDVADSEDALLPVKEQEPLDIVTVNPVTALEL